MGVGADGVEYLTLGDNGGYSIRLFNADGSEGEISGNGTRCVAAYLAQEDDASEFSIRTHAGLRRCRILQRNAPRYLISTEMGVPTLKAHTVTLRGTEPTWWARMCRLAIRILSLLWTRRILPARDSHGRQLGAEICTHPDFPKGTNVEFVRVTDTNRIEFRIFERGVGPTLSSGTGSSASATASMELEAYGSNADRGCGGRRADGGVATERLEPDADGACGNHRARGVSAGMTKPTYSERIRRQSLGSSGRIARGRCCSTDFASQLVRPQQSTDGDGFLASAWPAAAVRCARPGAVWTIFCRNSRATAGGFTRRICR